MAQAIERLRFVERRGAPFTVRVQRTLTLKQQLPEQQLAYGEVYVPFEVDTHGDFMDAEHVTRLAHRFMRKLLGDKVDVQHDNQAGRAHVVESFIAPRRPTIEQWLTMQAQVAASLGQPFDHVALDAGAAKAAALYESFIAEYFPFEPGAWVLGVKVTDADTWQRIRNGELTGFSFEALVKKIPVTVEVEDTQEVQGTTGEAAGHTHEFHCMLDADGNVTSGSTSETDGHTHGISENGRTDDTNGHRHTFSITRRIAA